MTECRWCGETHLKGVCPKVKAIEFAEDGETVRRVEFMTPRDCMPANGWPLQGAGPAVAVYPYVPPVAPVGPPPVGTPVGGWRYVGLAPAPSLFPDAPATTTGRPQFPNDYRFMPHH